MDASLIPLDPDDARQGLECVDQTGARVILDQPIDSWKWEIGVWWNNSWAYQGDTAHLGTLKVAA